MLGLVLNQVEQELFTHGRPLDVSQPTDINSALLERLANGALIGHILERAAEPCPATFFDATEIAFPGPDNAPELGPNSVGAPFETPIERQNRANLVRVPDQTVEVVEDPLDHVAGSTLIAAATWRTTSSPASASIALRWSDSGEGCVMNKRVASSSRPSCTIDSMLTSLLPMVEAI